MCGIAGIVDLRGQAVDAEAMRRLGDALHHRGPDGGGMHVAGTVGLVSKRLAIVDPAGGTQPLYNDDRSMAIVYNGEIYNYVELREELRGDYVFRTGCDTEVILRAYEKWGSEAVTRLRGMFAFAIHDTRRATVLLARDRIGIKPLYYVNQAGRLAFASELGALLRLPWIERRVNRSALAQYLRLLYIPDPTTIYSSIAKLEPGHVLEISVTTGTARKSRYWMLSARPIEGSEAEWLDALNHELDRSVRLHTRSDVEVGAFLSGGIDSSIVTAAMRPSVKGKVRTFSIGFDESEHSELPFAQKASAILGTAHTERVVTGASVTEELLRTIARHFGEPFGDSSAVPTWHVSNLAASQVKVVLSGDGGDEAFAGYGSYVDVLRHASEPRDALQKRHDLHRSLFTDEGVRALLPGIKLPERPRAPNGLHIGEDPVLCFQVEDLHTYLPGDVLTKVDRMSMANSVEVRVPLLDHVLLELAFAVPLALRIRERERAVPLTKYLLRRSGERFIPARFFDRPKQGFGIPVAEWCAGPLRPLIEGCLGARTRPVYELIDFGAAKRVWQRDLKGRGTGSRTWALLMLSLWVEEVHLAH